MIQKITVRFSDKDKGLKRIVGDLKSLNGISVVSGITKDKQYSDGTPVGAVAFFNEFGTDTIPQRSFLRSSFDENNQKLEDTYKVLYSRLLQGKESADRMMRKLGFMMETFIRNKIQSNIPPANAPSTLARKPGTRTLLDSQLMFRSVASEVKGIKETK